MSLLERGPSLVTGGALNGLRMVVVSWLLKIRFVPGARSLPESGYVGRTLAESIAQLGKKTTPFGRNAPCQWGLCGRSLACQKA